MPAKEIYVNQQRIEVVNWNTVRKARFEQGFRFIPAIKLTGKSTEHFGECDVHLRVTEVDGGIDQNGTAGGIKKVISTPEVAVQEGRFCCRKNFIELC